MSIPGGGPEGDLNRLTDKKVGVIGTGATGVQCIPHLGRGGQSALRFSKNSILY